MENIKNTKFNVTRDDAGRFRIECGDALIFDAKTQAGADLIVQTFLAGACRILDRDSMQTIEISIENAALFGLLSAIDNADCCLDNGVADYVGGVVSNYVEAERTKRDECADNGDPIHYSDMLVDFELYEVFKFLGENNCDGKFVADGDDLIAEIDKIVADYIDAFIESFT